MLSHGTFLVSLLLLHTHLYVDDIIIFGSSSIEIDNLIRHLNDQFALQDLSELSYFLGVEVSYPTNGDLFLSQSTYIMDVQS